MISGQVSEAEYITAHHVHRHKVAVAMNLTMALILAIGIIVFIVASKKWGMILAGGGVGGLVGEFVLSRIFLPSKLRKLYSQVKGRTELSYSWNDETLFLNSSHGNAARLWSDFQKAREDGEVILLYYNDVIFEILSKKWFRDSAQMNEFRKHLRFVK